MTRIIFSLLTAFLIPSFLCAQTAPSYSKDIRPFLAKYCVECHNAKTLKGTLDLETYKALMDGSDAGAVVKAGKPDESKLVRLTEHKDKPTMPPPKAKFQPTKDEVKLLRAWVLAGAKDDAVTVKVELPAVKAKTDVLAPVTGLGYAPNDKLLFIARNNEVEVVGYKPRKFGELAGGMPWIESFGVPKRVTALVTADQVQACIVGTSEAGNNAELYTIATRGRIPLATLPNIDGVLDLAIGVNKRRKFASLAVSGYDGTVMIDFDRKKQFHLKEHSDAVYGLAFNPDGTLLASVSADRAMKVWDVEKGKLLYTLGEATDWLYTVAWSPDGKYLVSGGVDKSIRVYEPTPMGARLRQSVFAHEGPVQKVLFSSDSKTLYSVGQDRVIKAWDVEKMVERKVYDKQPETVLCMALREDAGQIIIGRYDGIVQLIDMKTGKVVHEFGAKKEEKGRQGREHQTSSPQASAANLRGQPDGKPVPLIEVKNPGRSPASAQPVKLRGQIAGTLERAGDVHFFRLEYLQAGQPLGIRAQTKEVNSKLDPVLTITDMNGRILTESYDGHLGYKFTKPGSYAVSIRDRDFRGGADFKYRLHLGVDNIVTEVFPMGAQHGTNARIEVIGTSLESPRKIYLLEIPKDAKPGALLDVGVGEGILGKAQIVVGEFPEVTTPGKMPVPGTANGRIQKDGQNDVWTFAARKGQPLVVEVNARRLGSRLDSIIEILDKNDQPVPRAVLRSQAKTHVTFRDHDSAQGNIRIEAWSELGVNDFLYVGNELMKIQALPTHPDADCNFFATQGQRIGYLDTTPTHHANNTPMYKVNVHPPGTTFPPNGYPVFTLFYRNDDGGFGFGRDSRILFEPPADGEYKVRIADARGMGGVNFGYRLTVRPPRPGFSLKATPKSPGVPRGSAIPITITAERYDGFDGPILVNFKGVPKGLHMPATTIEAGTYTTTVALYAEADAKVPDKAPHFILEGFSSGNGSRLLLIGDLDLPKLIDPGDIVTTVKETEVALKPGQQAKMTVTIERRNGFTGRVPLDVKGLPHGVRVLDIGLNGILVNENETTRTVVLYAEPWVQAQDHPFVVLARHEGKKSEHAAKSVLLKVR